MLGAPLTSDSPLGTVSSLEHTIRSLDDRRIAYRETLASTQRRIEELQPHVHKPFDHDRQLQSLIQRQQEILNDLDLTKNQAPSTLDAEPPIALDEAVNDKITGSAVASPSYRITA